MLGSLVRSFRPSEALLSRCVGLAATVGLLCNATAYANATVSEPRLALRWSAPPECPTSTQITLDVLTLLARKAVATSEPIVVEATVRATRDGRYALEFTANGQQRRIEGATCKQIAEAAALLLALLIDPDFSSALPPETATTAAEPTPKSQPAAAVAPAPVMPSAAPTRRDRAAPTRTAEGSTRELIGEVAARLDWGSWPKLEPMLVAGFGMQTSKWRVLGHAAIGERLSLLGEPSAHLDLMPVSVGLEPALRLLRDRWALEPGVGLELGIAHHRSAELSPKTHDALSLTILALLRATLDVGWGLRGCVGLGAGMPTIRPRWIHQSGTVYHSLGPSIRGEFGIQASF